MVCFPEDRAVDRHEFPASLELEQWARFKVEHHSVVATIDWLVIVALICEMAAAIAFFYILREAGALTWLGLAVWLTAIQLLLFEHIIVLAVDDSLMPKYLATGAADRPAIEVLASTLNRIRLVAATVGNHLDLGIAVPVIAAASLRLPQVPKWIGWLGIAAGILTWLPISYWPPPGFVAFMVWMAAMGITWLRLPER